jgi:hypothetical protein
MKFLIPHPVPLKRDTPLPGGEGINHHRAAPNSNAPLPSGEGPGVRDCKLVISPLGFFHPDLPGSLGLA